MKLLCFGAGESVISKPADLGYTGIRHHAQRGRTTMPDFVHLHCHSEYSLLDGAIRVKDLCTRAKDLGMPAVALTDHGNMHGALIFRQKAID
ncbi:MAG: hypothetical protein C0405_07545, partial [Desulfovibrio sp.]|nr:hypothetical protein [Desulfovibrio sp.]